MVWYCLLLPCLQRACDAVGLGVAKVVAVVHPREVGPGQEDLLIAQHQLGPVDAQEVLALRSCDDDQEEDGEGGGNL